MSSSERLSEAYARFGISFAWSKSMSVFDEILGGITKNGYHNHRLESHSDIISRSIIADLRVACKAFDDDFNIGAIRVWEKTKGPDDRTTDLLAGVANSDGTPNLEDVRLLVEHKSVITAHRNRNARYQDIDRERLSAHRANPKTIIAATVMVGTCDRVLNIPDCVAKLHKSTFPSDILPRLSTGDEDLWENFEMCTSENKPDDHKKTIALFRQLPVRGVSDTHLAALDFVLIAPIAIDNVNPPRWDKSIGIDAEFDYHRMIQHMCRLYTLRWHNGP